MSRYNTKNPVPSNEVKDFSDNAEITDELVNSKKETTPDRFGEPLQTWFGMVQYFGRLMTDFYNQMKQAIANSGYQLIDSFQLGAQITRRNQALHWPGPDGDGEYYRWDGALPKTVPANSTPQNSGGVGEGFWLSVGDAALRADLASPSDGQGAALATYLRKVKTTGVVNVQEMLDAQHVNIWEYANLVTVKPNPAKSDTWDWTPAFVKAVSDMTTVGTDLTVGATLFIPPGSYRVTSVDFGYQISILGDGAILRPFNADDTYPFLAKFNGHMQVYGLHFAMDYAINYDTAVWVRGRNMDFTNTMVWQARCGWVVGDPAWADNPALGHLGDSENTWTGGGCNWCLKAFRLYGLNTIITFAGGYRAYANPEIDESNPKYAQWTALPVTTVETWGALFYLTGAFLACFKRGAAAITAHVQPATEVNYKNSFGRALLSGSHVEASVIYATATGVYLSEDTTTTALEIVNCQGYIALPEHGEYWIQATSNLQQKIRVDDCGFYGETRQNLVTAPGAPTHIDENSFSNLAGALNTVSRFDAPTGYTNFNVANCFGSAQTLGGANVQLIMPNLAGTDLNSASRDAWYVHVTGVFIAYGEMTGVEVVVDLRFMVPSSTFTTTVELFVDGAPVDTAVVNGGYPRFILKTNRIKKGSSFYVTASNSSSPTLSGSSDCRIRVITNL